MILAHEPKLDALRIRCAGLCVPEPGGLAAFGFVIHGPTGVRLHEEGGVAARGREQNSSSLVACYAGAIAALRHLVGDGAGEGRRRLGAKMERLRLLSDSRPFVLGLSAQRRAEGPIIRPLWEEARSLMARFGEAEILRVSSEENAAARALAEAAYVETLEGERRARAKEVRLEPLPEKLGKGLYLANGRWRVDAVLGLCDCPDYRKINAPGRPRVRCKHLLKAERVWDGPALPLRRA
jgi:ribonuclease HI